jgi:hypothetical protein
VTCLPPMSLWSFSPRLSNLKQISSSWKRFSPICASLHRFIQLLLILGIVSNTLPPWRRSLEFVPVAVELISILQKGRESLAWVVSMETEPKWRTLICVKLAERMLKLISTRLKIENSLKRYKRSIRGSICPISSSSLCSS